MNNKNNKKDFITSGQTTENNDKNNQPQDKKYFWISLGCFAIGCVFFGLSFTILGSYATFASMILQLCAITFLNVQKKYYYFTACKVLRVASYVVMLLGAALILGLIIYKKD
jgi:hypothetical protein